MIANSSPRFGLYAKVNPIVKVKVNKMIASSLKGKL